MILNPAIDMGDFLPATPAKRRVTGDTQFMFQFYKPCMHFYAPNEHTATCMDQDQLRQGLVVALQGCPLLFGRLKIHQDKSVWLEYDPTDSNPPTIEFQHIDTTYAHMQQHGFAYPEARKQGMVMAIPDGMVRANEPTKPMLMIKVSYLADGGVAIFSMSNHVAFDGNAVFSFLAHWATCTRRIGYSDKTVVPHELQAYATSLVTSTTSTDEKEEGPIEISVAADKTPQEIGALTNKPIGPEGSQACVFSMTLEGVGRLAHAVRESGVLAADEWVSSNNVVAAFVGQCVARASMQAQTYAAGDWTVFQSMDMRRPLGLSLQGLGSPLILAQCQMTYAEIENGAKFPVIAKRVRQSINKYTGAYLQRAMDWMHGTYERLAKSGVDEPWRRF
ncbi:hypothetical protein EV175_005027, partial [Coemansia sp. RSA 1933]